MGECLQPILDAVPAQRSSSDRFIIAVAGPPAAGKTTLAAELVTALAPRAAVLGLDAFHFDDQVLEPRGDLGRKGAPHTFDVAGYQRMVSTLRTDQQNSIAIPEFDRRLELSRGSASIVSPDHDILVTEGNYLLLDEEPWSSLQPLFDLTVTLVVAVPIIEQRITQRWLAHGFTADEASRRLAHNDMPNAEYVLKNSRPADIEIESS